MGEAIAARLRISSICRIGAVAAMERGMIETHLEGKTGKTW